MPGAVSDRVINLSRATSQVGARKTGGSVGLTILPNLAEIRLVYSSFGMFAFHRPGSFPSKPRGIGLQDLYEVTPVQMTALAGEAARRRLMGAVLGQNRRGLGPAEAGGSHPDIGSPRSRRSPPCAATWRPKVSPLRWSRYSPSRPSRAENHPGWRRTWRAGRSSRPDVEACL
jgi:hypothetical protein